MRALQLTVGLLAASIFGAGAVHAQQMTNQKFMEKTFQLGGMMLWPGTCATRSRRITSSSL